MEQLMQMNQSPNFHFDDNPRIIKYANNNVVFTSLARKFESTDYDFKNNKLKTQEELYGHLFKHVDTVSTHRACVICGNGIKIERNGQFSNLLKHSRSCHRHLLLPIHHDEKKELTIDVLLKNQPIAAPIKDNKIKLKEKKALAVEIFSDLVINANYPFSEVENVYVRKALLQLDNQLIFPSRFTVRREVVRKLEELNNGYLSKKGISTLDENQEVMFAVSNDCTTSNSKFPYCALNAVVMDVTTVPWKINNLILGCDYFPPDHTQVTTFNQLCEALDTYLPEQIYKGIQENVSYGIFDCATATPREQLRVKNVKSVCCVGHRLNTLMAHFSKFPAMIRLKKSIETVFDIIKHSAKNLILLEKVQQLHSRKVLRPKFGASTRWEYDVEMYKRANYLFYDIDVLDKVPPADVKNSLSFSKKTQKLKFKESLDFWRQHGYYYLLFVVPYFERISFWLKLMQSSTEVTVSLTLTMIDDLKLVSLFLENQLSNIQNNATPAAPKIPREIADELTILFGSISNEIEQIFGGKGSETHKVPDYYKEDIFIIAECLDPRVSSLCHLPQNSNGSKFRKVHANLFDIFKNFSVGRIGKQLFKEYFISPPEQSNDDEDVVHDDDDDDDCPFASVLQSKKLVSKINEKQKTMEELQGRVASELNLYIQELKDIYKRVETKNLFDFYYRSKDKNDNKVSSLEPLQFWADHKYEYPLLAKIASVILAVPATVATGERTFSSLKITENLKRNRLNRYILGDLTVNYVRAREAVSIKGRAKWSENLRKLDNWPRIGNSQVITLNNNDNKIADRYIDWEAENNVTIDNIITLHKATDETGEEFQEIDIYVPETDLDSADADDDGSENGSVVDDDEKDGEVDTTLGISPAAAINDDENTSTGRGRRNKFQTEKAKEAAYYQRVKDNATKLFKKPADKNVKSKQVKIHEFNGPAKKAKR